MANESCSTNCMDPLEAQMICIAEDLAEGSEAFKARFKQLAGTF